MPTARASDSPGCRGARGGSSATMAAAQYGLAPREPDPVPDSADGPPSVASGFASVLPIGACHTSEARPSTLPAAVADPRSSHAAVVKRGDADWLHGSVRRFSPWRDSQPAPRADSEHESGSRFGGCSRFRSIRGVLAPPRAYGSASEDPCLAGLRRRPSLLVRHGPSPTTHHSPSHRSPRIVAEDSPDRIVARIVAHR